MACNLQSNELSKMNFGVYLLLIVMRHNNTKTRIHAVVTYTKGYIGQGANCNENIAANRGKAHNGEAWELIMQIPQLQRNNNCGNSKTNHNTEGYCLAFAYLLDNSNLLIMPILFRTMSLCSYNNAHITNCHSALFQFKWKLCSLSWQFKTNTL